MGTLYKKTNTNNWVFSYRKDGKSKTIMGEKHGLNNLVFNNKKEKKQLKRKLEERYEYGRGINYGNNTPKLRLVLDDVIIERRKLVSMDQISQTTFTPEKNRLELFWNFVKDEYGDINISRLDSKILNKYTDYCRDTLNNNSTTINNKHKVVQVLINYSLNKDFLTENPYDKVKIPRPVKRGIDDIPDQNEYLQIRDYLDNWVDEYLDGKWVEERKVYKLGKTKTIQVVKPIIPIYVISYIQTQLGMRVGEVLIMKWKKGRTDVGENHSRSYVYLSPKYDELVIHFKKNRRIVPVKPKLTKLLKQIKEDTGNKTYVLEGHNKTTRRKNKKYVGKGEPLDSSYCSRPLRKLLKEVGVDTDYTTHTLRHGFISELVRQNLSLKKIGEFVGHKHITMTELYTHLNTTDMKEILSKV